MEWIDLKQQRPPLGLNIILCSDKDKWRNVFIGSFDGKYIYADGFSGNTDGYFTHWSFCISHVNDKK